MYKNYSARYFQIKLACHIKQSAGLSSLRFQHYYYSGKWLWLVGIQTSADFNVEHLFTRKSIINLFQIRTFIKCTLKAVV